MPPSRRKFVLAGLAVALLAGALALRARGRGDNSSCTVDDDVPAADREAVGRAALNYIDAILGPDPGAAYDRFISGGPPDLAREQFVALAGAEKKKIGSASDLRVGHVYLTAVKGGGHQRTVCGPASRPEEWVAVETNPGPAQAHVVIEGRSAHNSFVYVIRMVRQEAQWRVQQAFSAPSVYMGKSAVDFEGMAAAEERDHHGLNAYMLYVEALALANRGPSFQLGIVPRIQAEIANVKMSGPLVGQRPFKWDFGGAHFDVVSIDPVGLSDRSGDKVYLVVLHEIDPWVDDAFAERKNRALIAAFAETYPEYKQAFGGLVVKGQEKEGSRIWGTIAENE